MKRLMAVLAFLPWLLGATEEAQRFFEEYQNVNWNVPLAESKLAAALALDPMNETFRYEELRFQIRKLEDCRTWRARIDGIKAQWERQERFRRDFPAATERYDEFAGFPMELCYTNGCSNISPSELAEMAQLCDRYRPAARDMMRRRYFPYDLSDGIQSLEELDHFYAVCIRSYRPDFYFDHAKWLHERLEITHKLLREAVKLVEEHPEWQEEVNSLLASAGNGGTLMHVCYVLFPNLPFEQEEVIRNYLHATTAFEIEAAKAPLPVFRELSPALEFMRNCIDAPRTQEAVSQCFDDYFTRLAALDVPELTLPGAQEGDWRLDFSEFTQYLLRDNGIGARRLSAFREETATASPDQQLRKLLISGDWQRVVDQAAQIRAANSSLLGYPGSFLYTLRLFHDCFRDPGRFDAPTRERPDEKAKQAFAALNADFQLDTRTYEELFQHPAYLFAVAAAERPDGLHLLLRNPAQPTEMRLLDGTWVEVAHSPRLFYGVIYRDGTASKLTETPIVAADYRRDGRFSQGNLSLFDVSADWLVAGTGGVELWVYDRRNGQWHTIDDFLIDVPRSLALIGDRIYVLNSSAISMRGAPIALSSVRTDGGGRKYYFNTRRVEKQNKLDSLAGTAFGMVHDNEKLYWVNVLPAGGATVYGLDDATGEITEIAGMKEVPGSIFLQDGKLYLQSAYAGESIYELEPGSTEARVTCLFNTRDQGWERNLSGSLLKDGGKLWIGGEVNACINLAQPMNSPMLLLPESTAVFRWSADAVIFVGPTRYVIVQY